MLMGVSHNGKAKWKKYIGNFVPSVETVPHRSLLLKSALCYGKCINNYAYPTKDILACVYSNPA